MNNRPGAVQTERLPRRTVPAVTTSETRDVPEAHRYEITADGALLGFAAYQQSGSLRIFTHTEISEAVGGQGVGSQLAGAALDDVRARGLQAVPRCPFIRAWIDRHPEYADLVAEPPRLDA